MRATLPMTNLPPDNPQRDVTTVQPDDPDLPHISIVGDTYTILLSGEDTAGKMCLIDMYVPPGGGPGSHRHDFEETFAITKGEIDLTVRGEPISAEAGETIHIPANAPHMFTNTTDRSARMFCICEPAGQEEFFLSAGVPVEGRTSTADLDEEAIEEQLNRIEALAPEYNTELLEASE